jgi:hypothetical protein
MAQNHRDAKMRRDPNRAKSVPLLQSHFCVTATPCAGSLLFLLASALSQKISITSSTTAVSAVASRTAGQQNPELERRPLCWAFRPFKGMPSKVAFGSRLCENSARDSVGSRRARIFAIFSLCEAIGLEIWRWPRSPQRDSVGSRRARIFAIFLALRGDRPRNLEVAQVPSEFSHSLGRSNAFAACSWNGRSWRVSFTFRLRPVSSAHCALLGFPEGLSCYCYKTGLECYKATGVRR